MGAILSWSGRASMTTGEEYATAREQREQGRAELEAIAQRLSRLAEILRSPRGVGLSEEPADYASPALLITVAPDDLVPWAEIEAAVRAFAQADATFRQLGAHLTPQQ